MYPAGFVSKHQTSINEWRRSPDRCLCPIPPNNFAGVCGQAIEITVARSDVYSSIRDDGTCPEPTLLFACSTKRLVFPKQLTVSLAEAIDDAVLSGRIDFAVVDCGRRIRVGADARLPDC